MNSSREESCAPIDAGVARIVFLTKDGEEATDATRDFTRYRIVDIAHGDGFGVDM